MVWELKISTVAVLQVEFLPILSVYKTWAAQQFYAYAVAFKWCSIGIKAPNVCQ